MIAVDERALATRLVVVRRALEAREAADRPALRDREAADLLAFTVREAADRPALRICRWFLATERPAAADVRTKPAAPTPVATLLARLRLTAFLLATALAAIRPFRDLAVAL